MLASVHVLVIIVLLWGWFAFTSVSAMLGYGDVNATFNNNALIDLLFYELTAGAIALVYLRKVGWQFSLRQLNFTWKQTFAGIALFFSTNFLHAIVAGVVILLGGNDQPLEDVVSNISVDWPLALIASIVNGAYEELFLIAFIFRAFKKETVMTVIGISTFLRVVAHVYQGPVGAVSVMFLGILFAGLYVKYRKIWPLIFAHILVDSVALIAYSNS